jgi:proteic killer suppression protein
MALISNAKDERELYAMKSLHYEKLKGRRKHQRSVRLNDQFRLLVEKERDAQGRYLLIIGIEDYH